MLTQIGFGQDYIKTKALSSGVTIVSDGKLEIIIHERSTLIDNEYRIINGIIFINKKMSTKGSGAQKEMCNLNKPNIFYKRVNSINFSSLKKNYIDHAAPDSDLEYDLIIKLNGETYNIHIYKVKVKPIFKLIKMINRHLSEKNKIGYNKFYLNNPT